MIKSVGALLLLLSVIFASERPSYFAVGGGMPIGFINDVYDATVIGHNRALSVLKSGTGYDVYDLGVDKGGGGSFIVEYSPYFSTIGKSGLFGMLGGYSYHGTKENVSKMSADDDELKMVIKGKLHEIKVVPNVLLQLSETSNWALILGAGGHYNIDKSYSYAYINSSQEEELSIDEDKLGASGFGFIAQGSLVYVGDSGGGISIETAYSNRNFYISMMVCFISI